MDENIELTEVERRSLGECVPYGHSEAPEGSRTAYVATSLLGRKMVQPLVVQGEDETYFTWQRSSLGEIAFNSSV